jgi:hypothetical protein
MSQRVTPKSKGCRIYGDFNYEEFYNFVIYYFEADASPGARNAA